MPRKTTSLAVTVAAFAAAAPTAHASDASLRQAVKQVDVRTKPDSQAFAKALARFSKTHKVAALRKATEKLDADVKAARSSVAAQQASSATVRKGRTMYLSALTKLGKGLVAYDAALADIQKGSSTRAKAHLATALKEINAANRSGTRAKKLIGVKG